MLLSDQVYDEIQIEIKLNLNQLMNLRAGNEIIMKK